MIAKYDKSTEKMLIFMIVLDNNGVDSKVERLILNCHCLI
jgi:hypothetical protein